MRPLPTGATAGALALLWLSSACGPQPALSRPQVAGTPRPHAAKVPSVSIAPRGLARWVPNGFGRLEDGTLAAVVADRRVILTEDPLGAHPTILDPTQIDDLGAGSVIPEALGGGMLFVGERSVRFATGFSAPLTVLARASAKPAHLNIGIGRRQILIDLGEGEPSLREIPTGRELPLDPPGLTELFGTPSGTVVALARGALLVSTSRAQTKRSAVERPNRSR